MSEYEARTLSVILNVEGASIFDERATTITIVDEGAGEFVEVSQNRDDLGKIAVCRQEWEMLRDAIDKMIKECRG